MKKMLDVRKINEKTMVIKEITEFLEKHRRGKHFKINCTNGVSIIDAVIFGKIKKEGQLVEIKLKWGNLLQRCKGGWHLKLQENSAMGIGGGKVKNIV